ncbi:mRNA-decapping enzyme subunit 2 [Puccinia graminis f. sp. tritici]|uniref:mRNA-decapping enzyme subunit 2 n=1 Tax=Puccinia graminis f. sp. tritici TaxID=56615 RepID=A0A5B0PWU8_PUCGR|nr:mRNA-decapping enzyme subunit 2 [Puccinia graminis f. sp. tritici]KAA1105368.1 mRNA-decapping enzyme subunit 2 [Puccinia graminis f. sp. tritici]
MPSSPSSSNNNHQHQHQQPRQSSSATLPATSIASSASVFSRMPLEDVLEDLASRFILNLPIVELSHIERVCFQVEQAHWFYEDFVRPNSLLNLPSYHLKTFTGLFFEKCDFLTVDGAPLAGWDPKTAYEKFMRYKERVPVCGAIMFNEDATQVLLVRGFKSNSSWSFPRGKINENELPKDCAIREVLEETGFNIEPYLSLPSSWSDDSKLSAIRKIRPTNPTPNGSNSQSHKPHQNCTLHSEGDDHFIEITIREQRLRMYLVTGIPNDTKFVTQTRQEIGRIAWFPLSDLPTFSASNGTLGSKQLSKMINVSCPSTVESQRAHAKFYMVVPFVNDMRTWLTNNHLLAPIGQSLPTPREHHQAYVQTNHPPTNQSYGGNPIGHPPSHHIRFENEAAAVHERVSRLQAFDFFQEEPSSTEQVNQDNRLNPSTNRKKNRRKQPQQPRKPPKEANHQRLTDNPSYHSDPQTSTDDEDITKVNNDTPWNDLAEGTRALQNFFFGSRNEELEGRGDQFGLLSDGPTALLDLHLRHDAANNGVSPLIASQLHATPDRLVHF